jgi:hypothetical protein
MARYAPYSGKTTGLDPAPGPTNPKGIEDLRGY